MRHFSAEKCLVNVNVQRAQGKTTALAGKGWVNSLFIIVFLQDGINHLLQGGHLTTINKLELLNEVIKVLEAGVQVSLLTKRHNLFHVLGGRGQRTKEEGRGRERRREIRKIRVPQTW